MIADHRQIDETLEQKKNTFSINNERKKKTLNKNNRHKNCWI